ncbi:MAG: hypothetical protein M3O73_03230 [Actinomycetota bacterium]|nr:hypothetical protein [Actinomycetota bacterium]
MSTRERRRRQSSTRRKIVLALVLALVFAVGIALGEALHDNPKPGSTTTQERTFTLLPESSTVTVTTP